MADAPDRIIIDLRSSREEAKRTLTADLIMELDLMEGGYQATYYMKREDGEAHSLVFQRVGLTREQLIDAHIEAIKQAKPKTALVRTGRHSSGHEIDMLLNPQVVKMILEDKLQAAHLLPRG